MQHISPSMPAAARRVGRVRNRASRSSRLLAWARALGEFGATIIFAGNFPGRTQTMPLAIYIGLELDLSTALTLSAILLSVSFLVLFIVKGLLRQRV